MYLKTEANWNLRYYKLCIFFLFPQELEAPVSWTRALWWFFPPMGYLGSRTAVALLWHPRCHHQLWALLFPCPSPSQLFPICLECGCTPDSLARARAPLHPGNVSQHTQAESTPSPLPKKGHRIPSMGSHKEQTEGTQLWLSMFLCQLFFQTCDISCGCPLDSVHVDSRLLVLSRHACSESPNSTLCIIMFPLVSISPAFQFPPNS